jgi:hypothetical protein
MAITLGQSLRPSLGIDGKELVHQRYDPNRGLVFGIQFNCIKKFASRMRPTVSIPILYVGRPPKRLRGGFGNQRIKGPTN